MGVYLDRKGSMSAVSEIGCERRVLEAVVPP